MIRWRTVVILSGVGAAVLAPGVAAARPKTCDGPVACCPEAVTSSRTGQVEVMLGLALVGLSNVNERAQTWDGDFWLFEAWKPTPGFVPQTEIVNETAAHVEGFDDTDLRGDLCVRSRRIRATLTSAFNLRVFPFDTQTLDIRFSDAEYSAAEVAYASRPRAAGIEAACQNELAAWKLMSGVSYGEERHKFEWDEGAPDYDYARFSFDVRRHVTYHLARFFLPLLLIVGVAFSVLWIDPADISTQSSIGVTCLLAAIAFQLAEAGTLPEVAYLTLADRVYTACYVAITSVFAESVYTNWLDRHGERARALVIDRRCRVVFPVALVLALVGSAVHSVMQS